MRKKKVLRCGLFVLAALFCVYRGAGTVQAASDPIRYALCDLRVLYLYDNPEAIDWPTIFYLNDQYGCRVDLVTVISGASFRTERSEIPGRQLAAWRCTVVSGNSARFDSVYARIWADRRADVVIVGPLDSAGLTARFAAVTAALKPRSGSLFNVVRIARYESDPTQRAITLNAIEEYGRHRERIESETQLLMGERYEARAPQQPLDRYSIESRVGGNTPDFVTGIRPLRLVSVIDSLLRDGAVRQALERKAGNYISLLEVAQTQSERPRLQGVVNAYGELTAFRDAAAVEPTLGGLDEYKAYLDELVTRVKQLAIAETGVQWTGEIVLRDSPYGPKVKFISRLVIAGPSEVKIAAVTFYPYWDSTAVTLDSIRQNIAPHQSYVREYLIDIDRRKLESRKPDSLKFSIEMEAGGIPMMLTSSLPVSSGSRLAVHFEPPFHFVQPFAALDVDKVVSSMALRVVIAKPLDFSGKAKVNLETPTGVFAGSYRQEIQLDKGQGTETARIPFSISKLFELGIQNMVVALVVDGRTVSTDTGIVRVAACHVPDTIKIGLLSDTSGYLEDILRMTDASWQTMSDRTLEVGDLGAYDVLLVGSGALKYYPSFKKVRGRIQDFVTNGGSLVIMGQPESWPSEALPISLAPTTVTLTGTSIQAANAAHDLLKRPSPILISGLSAYFERPTPVTAAVVSPCQPILSGPGTEMLLSVSTLGKGKIVYCGLPLVEMIGKLNIEAIHLLANILNY